MTKRLTFSLALACLFILQPCLVWLNQECHAAQTNQRPMVDKMAKADNGDNGNWTLDDDYLLDENQEVKDISDPLEPINRLFYHFNDKLYFWVLKPVCKGYNKVMPEVARRSIRSFFSNLYTPVRATNCLLQGKIGGFWREIARFIINTTAGGLGFRDAAFEDYHVSKSEEDFGQTLARYGLGFGPYLVIPFIGPSSLRDAVGTTADSFMYPPNYYMNTWENLGRTSYEKINDLSLRLGEYEALKESAIDPYVAIRESYYQYRLKLIGQ